VSSVTATVNGTSVGGGSVAGEPTARPDGLGRPGAWGVAAGPALSELVAGHRATFPWYDERCRQAGVGPEPELTDLPLVDEAVLTERYYTVDHPQLPDASAYLTSGTSSGVRKRILWTPDDHERYVAHRRDLFAGFLADVPAGSVAVADLGTGHAAASAHEVFTELGLDAHDIDFSSPVAEHVDRLNEWRPDVFFTMPMVLDQLLAWPEPLHIAPRKVMVVGDVAPANWRRHVAERFDIGYGDVLDVLGSIEIGAIAHHDPETDLYHLHDHIAAESLPVHEVYGGDPVELPPGGGILLLTSFARRSFPALRYVTGDVVIGLRTIEHHGRSVQAYERIDSRYAGDVKHGERISAHDLCTAVNHVLPGAVFEVANQGGLEIRVVADEVTPDDAEAIRAHLLALCPDVGQMSRSGLVAEVGVRAITTDELRSGHAKRRFNIREG
jgi:phenylacetate-coenzyme A ligase PaaK-like adenylate-forming protein